MKQISVHIRTLAPVVLSAMSNATVMTESHSYFSGSIVRGIVASWYIKMRGLGEQAEEDETFLSLFFNKLRFVAAYPMEDGTRSFVLPFSLQKRKDGREILDLMNQDGKAGYKSFKGFAVEGKDGIRPVTVRKTINLHMSRSDVQNKDGKERLAGRSMAGGIYNYEAIDAGQDFKGAIYGAEKELRTLLEGLDGSTWQCHAGRSRFTQYGRCRIELGPVEDVPEEAIEPQDNAISMSFDTPYLPENPYASPLQNIRESLSAGMKDMALRMQDENFDAMQFSVVDAPQRFFAKEEGVENFVGIWGMKRPREHGLAAGTIFQLKKKDSAWTESEKKLLQNVFYDGIGLRSEEGFGQLRVWPNQTHCLAEQRVAHHITPPAQIHEEVRRRAESILIHHLLAQAQIWAAEDVQASKGSFPDTATHFFSRMDALLGESRNDSFLHLRNAIEQERGNGSTPFAKALQRISIRGRKLADYMNDGNLKNMPYNQRDWQALSDAMQLERAIQAVGIAGGIGHFQCAEALFYTYWHWFFRYGRKASAGAGEGAIER